MRYNPETGLKFCGRCKQDKPLSEYWKSKARADGYADRCKECVRTSNPEGKKAYGAQWRKENHKYMVLTSARIRAKKDGVPFALTADDIYVPEYCPVCAATIERSTGSVKPNSPSLDKWNPKLGYVPGNVWIICHRCNTRKRDMSGPEILAFAHQLIDGFIRVQLARESQAEARIQEEQEEVFFTRLETLLDECDGDGGKALAIYQHARGVSS